MFETRRPGAALAAGAVLAWTIGVGWSSRGDLWLRLGGTAMLLGAAALALEWRALAPLLRLRVRTLAVGLAAGIVMAVATHVLFHAFASVLAPLATATARLYAAVDAPARLAHALWIFPIALGEELVWRGLIQGELQRRFRPGAAVAVMAAIYALAQLPLRAPVIMLAALGCGLLWGALRATTGALIAPFVAHVVWDEVVLFVAPLVRG